MANNIILCAEARILLVAVFAPHAAACMRGLNLPRGGDSAVQGADSPLSCVAGPNVKKNWLPLLFFPVLDIAIMPLLSNLSARPPFSSLNTPAVTQGSNGTGVSQPI